MAAMGRSQPFKRVAARGCTEPETLSYQSTLNCPTGADVRQIQRSSLEKLGELPPGITNVSDPKALPNELVILRFANVVISI